MNLSNIFMCVAYVFIAVMAVSFHIGNEGLGLLCAGFSAGLIFGDMAIK